MAERFDGKVAVVTGGAGGIGSAIAQQLVREGARVVIADRSETGARAVAHALGDAALPYELDVRQPESWHKLVDATERSFGFINVLVHAAGVILVRPLADTTVEDLHNQWAVNALGPIVGTQAVLESLKLAQGGSILVVSSRAGLQGSAHMTAYSASKAASISFTRSAALELAPFGIRVNAIAPGGIDTPMSRPLLSESARERFKQLPIPRIGHTDDVVPISLLLLSDEAAYITGQVVSVDGGASIA